MHTQFSFTYWNTTIPEEGHQKQSTRYELTLRFTKLLTEGPRPKRRHQPNNAWKKGRHSFKWNSKGWRYGRQNRKVEDRCRYGVTSHEDGRPSANHKIWNGGRLPRTGSVGAHLWKDLHSNRWKCSHLENSKEGRPEHKKRENLERRTVGRYDIGRMPTRRGTTGWSYDALRANVSSKES